ncbi:hypothetical protein MATL_G00112750 [Megalops atlanticus]|uniref:TNFR-Cys domain-containing protein n=1 Tax=Megalops atlanticus TaxID=7932 RepID=A0A9D3Q573_MEGAT|nr:hypothetical protein MATL_G00112750 [Megalops atlanticus]
MVNVVLFLCDITYACGVTEYEFGEKCCSMCEPGTRVVEHCSENTNTSCAPCSGETFIDTHSNFMKCFPCAVCDPGLNLKIYEACTSTSNTVCGPLDQHFCTEQDRKGSCRKAERHTICKPGQFVKQKGTASTDTICGDCPDKAFSDGLSTYCKPHRDCKSEGLVEQEQYSLYLEKEEDEGSYRDNSGNKISI